MDIVQTVKSPVTNEDVLTDEYLTEVVGVLTAESTTPQKSPIGQSSETP